MGVINGEFTYFFSIIITKKKKLQILDKKLKKIFIFKNCKKKSHYRLGFFFPLKSSFEILI
jgi:hypothetical protein